MSSTTTTQFYGLTQYIGTDKPDFADNNQAFRNLDADLHQVVQDSQGFTSDIADLTERVGNLDTDLTNLSNDLDGEKAKITALQNKELSQDTEISRVERNAQDMITAYNEASATSTHAYAVGDYFIYNNVLYQATAAIAVGATIVPDTNCKTTNVTSELIQLNTSLANISQNTPDVIIDNTGRKNGQMLFMLLQQIDFSKVNVNTKLEIGTNVFTLVTLDSTNQHLRFSRNDLKSDGSVRIINANVQNDANFYQINEAGTFTDISNELADAPFIIYY